MNVVDSSAWLSYFAGDKNASTFTKPIEATAALLVPNITLTEVFKHVPRHHGETVALEVVADMEQGKVIDLNNRLAIDAACLGLEYKLPLVDSIIYATS